MSPNESMLESIRIAQWVDLTCLALVVFGMIQGGFRGFSGEIARVFSTIAAIAVAITLREPLGAWLAEHTRLSPETWQAPLLAFAILLVSALLVLVLLRRFFRKCIRLVVDPPADILLGIPCGGVKIVIFFVLILLFLFWMPFPESRTFFHEQTRTGKLLHPVAAFLHERLSRYPAITESAAALTAAASTLHSDQPHEATHSTVEADLHPE